MDFRRSLTVAEFQMWETLLNELASVGLNIDSQDEVIWALENKELFTKSLYRFITNRGASSRVAGFIWKSTIPMKIKFFLWQMFNNKLQVALSLSKRGWKEGISVVVEIESV